MCPLYVAGLIGPGDRKSVQPMAALLASGDYDQLKSRKSSAKKQKRAASRKHRLSAPTPSRLS